MFTARGFLVGAISLLSALLAGCATLEMALQSPAGPSGPEGLAVFPGSLLNQYIVVLQKDTPSAANVAEFFKKKANINIPLVFESALKGFVVTLPALGAGLDILRNHPAVDFIQPDGVVEAFDLSLPLQPQDHVAGEIPTGVNRFDAELNPNTASGINVAVLDTGIYKHGDLNVKTGKDCTAWWGSGSTSDQNGHGTHVAGTIGAKDNGTGVVGVAPGVKPVSRQSPQQQGVWDLFQHHLRHQLGHRHPHGHKRDQRHPRGEYEPGRQWL